MSLVRIPAPKKMEPGMDLMEIDYIWDYLDSYVEEEITEESDDNLYNGLSLRELMDLAREALEETREWGSSDCQSDYYDAFEDDPEACWGREW